MIRSRKSPANSYTFLDCCSCCDKREHGGGQSELAREDVQTLTLTWVSRDNNSDNNHYYYISRIIEPSVERVTDDAAWLLVIVLGLIVAICAVLIMIIIYLMFTQVLKFLKYTSRADVMCFCDTVRVEAWMLLVDYQR